MKTHPLAIYAAVFSNFIGYTGAGFGLGYWLWKRYAVSVWVLVILTLAGFAVACWRIITYQRELETKE